MKKLTGIIFDGEKLGVEKLVVKGVTVFKLHVLKGVESVTLKVADNQLVATLDKIPNREKIVLQADAMAFKDDLYLTLTNVELASDEVA